MKRSHRTIQNWVADGMPTRLRDGQNGTKFHEVREDVLWEWFRVKTKANPVHVYRQRKRIEGIQG